jgi:CRISPR type III-B/RAMP module-associated protein Cmr5
MEEKMIIKTQNQERAKFVFDNIEVLKKSNYADKLTSYILTNGLLPTLAFIKSKDGGTYQVIEKYFKHTKQIFEKDKDIIQQLVDSDSTRLGLATIEALELANWIRRFVKSEQ